MRKTGPWMFAVTFYLAQVVVTAHAQTQPTTETVLHRFGGARGMYPMDRLNADSAGNIYGTATQGGTAGDGVVFMLSQTLQETVLHNFEGGTDGYYPENGVMLDPAGNLYGVTYLGGAANQGVVYEVSLQEVETILRTFTGGADGGNPECELVRGVGG